MFRPALALTIGDPAGIGPEIVLKALAPGVAPADCTYRLFASRSVLERTFRQLRGLGIASLADPDSLDIVDIQADGAPQPGVLSAAAGALSFAYLQLALRATGSGACQALVTAPIHKSAWHLAGHRYAGQTEVLAEATNCPQPGMLFVARSPITGWTLRVLLATTHIPLSQVSGTLNRALVEAKLRLLFESLRRDFGLEQPRVAVAGLNPHSGENGQIGAEEVEWLAPLLTHWSPQPVGPVPPDTLFVGAGSAWRCPGQPAFDAYLALYHDQGLIPVKLLAFDQAVNTTIGLPIVRTSPDHGTAFDIVGRGVARPESLIAAIELAAELARRRAAPNRLPLVESAP